MPIKGDEGRTELLLGSVGVESGCNGGIVPGAGMIPISMANRVASALAAAISTGS
jgi:hypothetical protein